MDLYPFGIVLAHEPTPNVEVLIQVWEPHRLGKALVWRRCPARIEFPHPAETW